MYLVYILKSDNLSYVGMTNDFFKRFRQHNGELVGGAKYTKKKKSWYPICIIDGFKDKKSACQCEWRLKHGGRGKLRGANGRLSYLSKFLNCGTSIYHPKNTHGYIRHADVKNEYYKNNDANSKIAKAKKENNDPFEETIRFNSRYNRLILFDGFSYHCANSFKHDDDKEERLTLITFFNSVARIDDLDLKKPVTTMRRIT